MDESTIADLGFSVADVGRRVTYIGNRYPDGVREFGVITSIGPRPDGPVFVRYGSNTQSQATSPEDLVWG